MDPTPIRLNDVAKEQLHRYLNQLDQKERSQTSTFNMTNMRSCIDEIEREVLFDESNVYVQKFLIQHMQDYNPD